jgi:hypothetical protein
MGAAALPGSAGRGRLNGGDQALMGVGGDQPDDGESAGDQIAEEGEPAGTVFGRGEPQAKAFAIAVSIDSGELVKFSV